MDKKLSFWILHLRFKVKYVHCFIKPQRSRVKKGQHESTIQDMSHGCINIQNVMSYLGHTDHRERPGCSDRYSVVKQDVAHGINTTPHRSSQNKRHTPCQRAPKAHGSPALPEGTASPQVGARPLSSEVFQLLHAAAQCEGRSFTLWKKS